MRKKERVRVDSKSYRLFLLIRNLIISTINTAQTITSPNSSINPAPAVAVTATTVATKMININNKIANSII